jgi:L-lysine exporter family protein LysE/ArgO
MNAHVDAFSQGVLLAGGLIVAIGSQAVFVLKQGIVKNYIFSVCLLCFVCDVILMTAGVMGFGKWITSSKCLLTILFLSGAGFLFVYSMISFISAYRGCSRIDTCADHPVCKQQGLAGVIMATLAVTLLNPHVYLDTFVVIGSVACTLSRYDKLLFLLGALIVSFVWFFGLGYGSRVLIPLFRKRATWRILNLIIGCIMFFLSIHLLRYALA